VRKVVEELERRLQEKTVRAVRGSLDRVARTTRPRPADIDWDRTIRANLKSYQPEHRTIIPEKLLGNARRRKSAALRDIILCVDQSGSMASTVVYSGIFGAVLASIRAVNTRMVAFDTSVADLTEDLQDPVDLLFGVQLGGGTDINRALAYCQTLVSRPTETVLVLITDLYEGGDRDAMLKRAADLTASGVNMACLLALSDDGAPTHNPQLAAALANLGVPAFACTPDLFPDMMAAAIQKQDLDLWAARNDIVTARGEG
jgi:Mg-chelatase subunit ChlD